jgi:hypothetical protein
LGKRYSPNNGLVVSATSPPGSYACYSEVERRPAAGARRAPRCAAPGCWHPVQVVLRYHGNRDGSSRERPNAWRCCPLLPRRPRRGRALSCCRTAAPSVPSGAAEPPEPLPYAVPFAIFAGQCTPRYAVYREVVEGFQEFTVVMPRLSPARLGCIEHFQHDRPIALRHSRQHVRLPVAGHAVIRTKPDSGIRQKCMSGIPSTRP